MTFRRRITFGLLLGLGLAASPGCFADLAHAGVSPEFITLGTGGGPRVQVNRSQPANAVKIGQAIYLFDAGEGAQRQMKAAGLALADVRAVFVSHYHIDHIGGLAPIVVNRWVHMLAAPLPIIGPPGTVKMAGDLVEAFRPTELAPVNLSQAPVPMAATVAAVDMPLDAQEPIQVFADDNIRVLAVLNDHYHYPAGSSSAQKARSYAFRIEAGGHSIVYSGDTGPSVRLEKLAVNADLLVSEVMDRAAIESELSGIGFAPDALAGFLAHMDADHLTPAQVGALARRAHVGAVVLTHLVPGSDNEKNNEGYLRGIAAEFSGPIVVARDLQRFDLSSMGGLSD